MRQPDELLDGAARSFSARLAAGMTRRSFLGRLGGVALAAAGGTAVAAAVKPEQAEAFHICGHIWTTGSCPSPLGLPRVNRDGYPIRPKDGRPIDNLGRRVNRNGYPVDDRGQRMRGPDGRRLERAPRTRLCEDWVRERFGLNPVVQGSWYRCCNGRIRKIVDCCTPSRKRINGDASLVGYCWSGRRVFCILYFDSGLPC